MLWEWNWLAERLTTSRRGNTVSGLSLRKPCISTLEPHPWVRLDPRFNHRLFVICKCIAYISFLSILKKKVFITKVARAWRSQSYILIIIALSGYLLAHGMEECSVSRADSFSSSQCSHGGLYQTCMVVYLIIICIHVILYVTCYPVENLPHFLLVFPVCGI